MKAMGGIALGVAVCLATTTPTLAASGFRYKDASTSLTLDAAKTAGLVNMCREKELDGASVQTCHAGAAITAGGIAGEDIYGDQISFDAAGLVGFDLSFRRESLPTIKAAFVSKYGKPCRLERETLQNAFGATFSQVSDVWCFSDGTLWLSRYDPDYLDNAASMFRSDRFMKRRAAKPAVNF